MKETFEFWVTDETEEAIRKAKVTLRKVGELTRVVPGEHIEGEVQFGVKPVRVSITWREETAREQAQNAVAPAAVGASPAIVNSLNTNVANFGGNMGTTLILELDAEDPTSSAHKSVRERFEDAYRHFDRPDYAPDRLGVLPLTILGIVAVIILLVGYILATPRLRAMLPGFAPTKEQKASPSSTSAGQS